MTTLTISLMAGAVLMGLSAVVVFLSAVRQGHFDDLEDVKFQMFREEKLDETDAAQP